MMMLLRRVLEISGTIPDYAIPGQVSPVRWVQIPSLQHGTPLPASCSYTLKQVHSLHLDVRVRIEI